MSELGPDFLEAQAVAAVTATRAARSYFDAPGPASAALARKARMEARLAREAADVEIEKTPDRRADWLKISAALARLAEEVVLAVEEDERLKANLGAVARGVAAALQRAAFDLRAAFQSPRKAPEALTGAKHAALEAEERRREGRRQALEQPNVPTELAAQAVLERLANAAEAVHGAADILVARLGETA